MRGRWRPIAVVCLIITVMLLGGCDFNYKKLFGDKTAEKPRLVKVEIRFDSGDSLTGYVKDLGVGEEGVIYTGGSSANYLYDAGGNVTGVFNYHHVLYMRVLK